MVGCPQRKVGFHKLRVSRKVMYQGGPPSAHATPIRLPNGQLVTHKRMYFDIRKPGNPFYDSDFFERKNATMRVRYLFHSRFQTLSATCSRQFNYHELRSKEIFGHSILSIVIPIVTSTWIFSGSPKQNSISRQRYRGITITN